jgi:hypothetical protein
MYPYIEKINCVSIEYAAKVGVGTFMFVDEISRAFDCGS